MMLGLAITVALIAVLFLYVRMKFQAFEERMQLMSDTIQTMAGVTRIALQSESESDDESVESEDSVDSECNSNRYPSMEECMPPPQRVTVSDDDVKHVIVPELDDVELLPDVMKLSISNEPETTVKTVALPTPFDGLSVKELKEKVAELNGPKLKSKKELLDFLQGYRPSEPEAS
jgi:hypothetical protein